MSPFDQAPGKEKSEAAAREFFSKARAQMTELLESREALRVLEKTTDEVKKQLRKSEQEIALLQEELQQLQSTHLTAEDAQLNPFDYLNALSAKQTIYDGTDSDTNMVDSIYRDSRNGLSANQIAFVSKAIQDRIQVLDGLIPQKEASLPELAEKVAEADRAISEKKEQIKAVEATYRASMQQLNMLEQSLFKSLDPEGGQKNMEYLSVLHQRIQLLQLKMEDVYVPYQQGWHKDFSLLDDVSGQIIVGYDDRREASVRGLIQPDESAILSAIFEQLGPVGAMLIRPHLEEGQTQAHISIASTYNDIEKVAEIDQDGVYTHRRDLED